MQTVTASEFRLRVSELIDQLQPGKSVLIRRRFDFVALLIPPSDEEAGKVTKAITVRAFREHSSELLNKIKAGERILLRSRGQVAAVLVPAPEDFVPATSPSTKTTCSLIFRNLKPVQLEHLLKILNPHIGELEMRGVRLEFC